MKQTTTPAITGLSRKELNQLLSITPETIALSLNPVKKTYTAAQFWSLERGRKLAAGRRRLSSL